MVPPQAQEPVLSSPSPLMKALQIEPGEGRRTLFFAILNGQMKLKEGPVRQKLFKLLDLSEGDIA